MEALQQRLDTYVAGWAHMPRQKTREWETFKLTTIGGSQMSTILNQNPYESVRTLVAGKVGLANRRFSSTIKTQWGNLFESLIRQYIEHTFNTKIVGDDLLISTEDCISYSPDGLGVIMRERSTVVEIDGKSVEKITPVPTCVLFEFKCPFNRIPNGRVPDYYLPQVKTGLDVIDIADCGLFAEAVFRRCSWQDLNDTLTRDKSLVAKSSGQSVLAYGFIGFYSNAEHWIGDWELELRELEQRFTDEGYEMNDTNDLGVSTPDMFQRVMRLYDRKIINTWYSGIVYANTEDNTSEELDEFVTHVQHGNYIWGILPWKLFRIDVHYIEKTPGYLNSVRPQICEIIGLVKRCIEADPADRQNMYDEYFAGDTESGFAYDE